MTIDEFRNWLKNREREPLLMGVLNITPDSFSDGNRYSTHDAAVARAEELASEGAAIIDIGGESTRPGSEPVKAAEQIRRIVPVVTSITKRTKVLMSVDTTSAEVARAALDAGCAIVNDISGGREDAGMLPLVAERRVPVVLMHMKGNPKTMQMAPTYNDVVGEIRTFLAERLEASQNAGIDREDVLLDPGIGFGKTMQHNLELIRRTGDFAALGRPIVVGVSRKGFIGTITGESLPANRLFGTAASVAWCIANGAAIVRVHDVKPMRQVMAMTRAIQAGSTYRV